jgi:hypothetical protein
MSFQCSFNCRGNYKHPMFSLCSLRGKLLQRPLPGVRCHPSFARRQMAPPPIVGERLLHCYGYRASFVRKSRTSFIAPSARSEEGFCSVRYHPSFARRQMAPPPRVGERLLHCLGSVPCVCPSACFVSSLAMRKSQTSRTWLPRPEEGFCHWRIWSLPSL